MMDTLEKKIEKLARRISKDVYGSEGMWQMFMLEATQQTTKEIKDKENE